MSDERSWAVALSRQSALDERHADRQGHGALRRHRDGRGRSIARRLEGARAKPISIAPGGKNGPRRPIASLQVADKAAAKGARSRPAITTCARETTTTARSASFRPALRRWRCIAGATLLPGGDGASHPDIERVEVPYEDASLPAYFVKGRGTGRRPTVVLFDGMDNAKEMSVIFAGLDFAKRGINTLAIDGPGQAEALRLRNIHSRHDYEVPGTAAYDYVAARPEVDPKRVAVMGYSFGGYQAPRIAAFDKRYAACVAFGAMHWSIYEWVAGNKAKLAVDPRKSSTSIFQFRWVVGAPDNETALEWAKKFTLEGSRRISNARSWSCMARTTASSRWRRQRRSMNGSARSASTLRIFTAAEGGAEHCQVDHRRWASTTSATGCSRICRTSGRNVACRSLSTQSPVRVRMALRPPANGGEATCDRPSDGARSLCALLGVPTIAQAQNPAVVSGLADPLWYCVSARRRDRHPDPPDHAGIGRGIGPVRRHREQAGRRRLHRSVNHVVDPSDPDGYTLLMAEKPPPPSAMPSTRKARRNSIRSSSTTRSPRVATFAAGSGSRQQRAGQDGGGADRACAHGTAENELCLRRHRQRCASDLRGGQGSRPESTRFTRPTRPAGPRHERSARRPRVAQYGGHPRSPRGWSSLGKNQGACGHQSRAFAGAAERADPEKRPASRPPMWICGSGSRCSCPNGDLRMSSG